MGNLLLLLHEFGAIVWIGGMFFAHMVLRPTVAELLQPPQRLPLMAKVFSLFFPWVWLSLSLILVSGIGLMVAYGTTSWPVHAMSAIGGVMVAIFAYVYFVLYRRLKQGVAAQDWPAAGQAMARIRLLVGINLSLGLSNVLVIFLGREFL